MTQRSAKALFILQDGGHGVNRHHKSSVSLEFFMVVTQLLTIKPNKIVTTFVSVVHGMP